MSILIYGANGYTGNLVVQEALKQGLKPVIAGRNLEKIEGLAKSLVLEFKVFDLLDIDHVVNNIRGFDVVLHLAGPFRDTARPMAEACLRAGVHYLDITGEIAIMEWMKELDSRAKKSGIMLMCGVGFDLVPTDCVAVKLKTMLPEATNLEIAFLMEGGGISHGTMTTMVGNLGRTSYSLRNHLLIEEPLGKHGKYFDFGTKQQYCFSIPWGDLFSAHESTGIPNITTYVSASKATYYLLQFQQLFNPILRSHWFQKVFQRYIDKYVTGPSMAQNKNGRSYVRGIAFDNEKAVSVGLAAPESYLLTAIAAIIISKKVLNGNWKVGFQTPAGCYGWKLIEEVDGVSWDQTQ